MSDLWEVQEEEPELALRINRVGIRGVRRKVTIYTPKGELQFDVVMDAYVDLPVSKRGIHMSRNIEAFVEAIEQAQRERPAILEEVLSSGCRRLLQKHPYATRAEMIAKTTYYYEEDFTGVNTPQAADVAITTMLDRGGKDKRSVSVSILGITVCPSAQAMYSRMEKTRLPHTPSHSQRAKLTVQVITEGRFVRLEQLIEAARRAFSAPTVSLLKKSQEHLLIRHAFERPRFIEDLVRYALHDVYRMLLADKYPKNTVLHVEAESYESVHPHNAYASRTATLRELMDEEKRGKRGGGR
jgi:GTP cyclohydrolase-4